MSDRDDREQRGLAIAALFNITRDGDKYLVPSQKGDGRRYTVDPASGHCTCPDHEEHKIKCKHLFAVEFSISRERGFDGTTTITRTVTVRERVTYRQDWPAYNKAQTQEKRLFCGLLADLCRGLPDPPPNPKGGRQPLPMADLVFAAAFKCYVTVSTRRLTCDLQDAAEKGFIKKAPHFNSVLRVMEDPALTPILKRLIIESSRPLAAVETEFASDSSGFSTCRFVKWFDIKYGKTMEEREWVKCHIACGVKTNVITAVEILDKHAADAPLLPALVRTTRENFQVKEWSADAIYATQENFGAIDAAGATPYIPFKETATGGVGGLFQKAFRYYQAFQDEFRPHYHKRSNIESTFSMVKAKFGDAIRSKCDVAMVNEVLTKLLCHNLCCLIQSMFELGVDPEFWGRPREAAGRVEAPVVEVDEDEFAAMAWM
jgi:transposase